MASAVTTEKITANAKLDVYDFDPDADTATEISWQPMRDFGTFLAAFVRTIGTGNLDTFSIQTASDSSGTGAIDVVVHAVGSEPNLIPDKIVLECTAEQCREVLAAATHVSAIGEFATSTDEGLIIYLFGNPKHSQSGMTADVVA